MREISSIISPFLIIIILTVFSFSLELDIDAHAAEEYRHNVIGTVPVGDAPSRIAINPINGFIYVANSGSNSVNIIDPFSQRVIEEVSVGNTPTGLAFRSYYDYIYV